MSATCSSDASSEQFLAAAAALPIAPAAVAYDSLSSASVIFIVSKQVSKNAKYTTGAIDVKNVLVTLFTFFNVFFNFPNLFYFLKNVDKVQSGTQINKKHFQNNSSETDL